MCYKKPMIIQANPGFFRVFKDDEKKLFVDLSPIIAWQINEKSGLILAITTDGIECDEINSFGYLCPNGAVSCIDAIYPSLEDAQKAISE